jgi:hypothetical protein
MAWPTTATGMQNVTTHDKFIPELWSDEVLGAYKTNLVLGNLVTMIPMAGKKGDVIHIPVPGRNAATKRALTSVAASTLLTDTATEVDVTIDQHFEYTKLISDIVELQAIDSYRQFYTDDAGYALARQVDWHLHLLARLLQGGAGTTLAPDNSTDNVGIPGSTMGSETYDTAVIGGDGSTTWDDTANTNTGNQTALSDVGIRTMIQLLDDADIPLMDRNFVIPPVEKNNLLGLSRFTEQSFTGESAAANSIRTGLIGDVYGVPVYVSSNCVTVQPDDDSTNCRAGLLMHKGALAYAEQMAIRTQEQYKLEFFGSLFSADVAYGVKELRDTSGVVFIVPA